MTTSFKLKKSTQEINDIADSFELLRVSRSTSDLQKLWITLVVRSTEYLQYKKQNNTKDQFYDQFFEESRFSDKALSLVKNSPPFLNPFTKDIKLSDGVEGFMDYYKDFMEIEDKGDHYLIGKEFNLRRIWSLSFSNFSHLFFYSERFKHKPGQMFSSDMIDKYRMNEYNSHLKLIHMRSIHRHASRVISGGYIKREFDKKDFDIEYFKSLCFLAYYDFVLDSFYSDFVRAYEKLNYINFIESDKVKSDHYISFDRDHSQDSYRNTRTYDLETLSRAVYYNLVHVEKPNIRTLVATFTEEKDPNSLCSIEIKSDDGAEEVSRALHYYEHNSRAGLSDNIEHIKTNSEDPIYERSLSLIKKNYSIDLENLSDILFVPNFVSIIEEIRNAYREKEAFRNKVINSSRWVINNGQIKEFLEEKINELDHYREVVEEVMEGETD